MQKILAAILLVVYFTVSSGFAVSMHYCMDKISSVQLGAAKSEKCDKCGMKKSASHGCCRDEVKVIRLHQDLVPAHFTLVDFSAPTVLLSLSNHLVLPFFNFTAQSENKEHFPPLLPEQDTYLTNCVFRI